MSRDIKLHFLKSHFYTFEANLVTTQCFFKIVEQKRLKQDRNYSTAYMLIVFLSVKSEDNFCSKFFNF